jgi:hypothetical protein
MNNIKIVRLQNGDDIMGNVTFLEDSKFIVSEPMSVGIEFRGKEAGLMMHHWLPVQLIKNNSIIMEEKNILCLLEPNDEFTEYYLNTVERIKGLLSAKHALDSLDDEEPDDIMDAFEELINDGRTVH